MEKDTETAAPPNEDPAGLLGRRMGNHLLTGVLGHGGMGVVYEAVDTQLARKVAVKVVLSPGLGREASERFLREARSAARLVHPNVVATFELGEQDGTPFLVMEYLDGGSLADSVHRGPLPWREATRLILEACRGLAAAHESGLIHRDLKPANILRSRGGTAKLVDFGLAKLAEGMGPTLTVTGRIVGTPAYMSPEQCHGEPVDHRTDIYAMGACYYALLTAHGPYAEATTTPQILFAHCYKPVPDPRQISPAVPAACASIVAKSMAKSPADRYQSAEAMMVDLAAVLDDAFGNDDTLSFPATDSRSATAAPVSPSAYPPTVEIKPGEPGSGAAVPPPLVEPGRWNRRRWIAATAAATTGVVGLGIAAAWPRRRRRVGLPSAPIPASANAVAPAPTGPPIKLGLLASLSGFLASSEASLLDGALLAVEELNASGGVLGRKVQTILGDGQSDPETFAREARRLIDEEQVATLIGCWSSASRKAVRPVVEEGDHLLIYPLQYEGLEDSPCIFYTGAAPNQQMLPAIKWAFTDLGRSFFLVGTDYIFPRVANAILRDQIEALGGEVAGEAYLPPGTTVVAEVVSAIAAAGPSVIVNTINGDTNLPFFRELRGAGITSKRMPSLSFSLTESNVREIGTSLMAGDYAAWNYFASLETPDNRTFLERFHDRYGPQRQPSDPTEAAYLSVCLWAEAVKTAGSVRPAEIRAAMPGRSFRAPEGVVTVDEENHHTWKMSRIAQIRPDGQFDVFTGSARPIRPEPFPASRPRAEWEELLNGLHEHWGGRWSAPSV